MTQVLQEGKLRTQLLARCSWCGSVVDLPLGQDPWRIQAMAPAFCGARCLQKYREHLASSPF